MKRNRKQNRLPTMPFCFGWIALLIIITFHCSENEFMEEKLGIRLDVFMMSSFASRILFTPKTVNSGEIFFVKNGGRCWMLRRCLAAPFTQEAAAAQAKHKINIFSANNKWLLLELHLIHFLFFSCCLCCNVCFGCV